LLPQQHLQKIQEIAVKGYQTAVSSARDTASATATVMATKPVASATPVNHDQTAV
jgi:hypothetical protein